jgi:hypothetical protein
MNAEEQKKERRWFKTVEEALRAVAEEPWRANITYTKDRVYVFSRFGIGTFSPEEWEKGGGPKSSVSPDGPKTA